VEEQSQQVQESYRIKFLKTEYQEAAKAFSLGVQVGQSVLYSYLFGTTVLVTLFGATGSLIKEQVIFARLVLPVIPIFGIVASILAIILLRYYDGHLDGCRDRCVELERQFDGRTFTNIKRTSDAAKSFRLFWIKVKFNGVFGFQLISSFFVLMWAYLLLAIGFLK
jgi:hypothetical protein